jgi:hypothetical protein
MEARWEMAELWDRSCDPNASEADARRLLRRRWELSLEEFRLERQLDFARDVLRRFKAFKESGTVITIEVEDSGDNYYDPATDTIHWNPRDKHGGHTQTGTVRDPHIGLGHEISHAFDDALARLPDTVRWGPPSDGDTDRWKNQTEENACKFENEIRAGRRVDRANPNDKDGQAPAPAPRERYRPHRGNWNR